MMGLSFPHLALLAVVVLVLFGRGRISEMMGDFGKGIKSFKEGMSEDTTPTASQPVAPPPAQQIPVNPSTPAAPEPVATVSQPAPAPVEASQNVPH